MTTIIDKLSFDEEVNNIDETSGEALENNNINNSNNNNNINENNNIQSPIKSKEDVDTVKEILAEKIQNSRPLCKVKFTRKWKYFGRELQNIEEDTMDTYRFFPPVKDPRYQQTDSRLERDFGVQTNQQSILLNHKSVQTEWCRKVNHSSQVNISESLSRDFEIDEYRIVEFLKKVEPVVVETLAQNSTIDIFKDDFSVLTTDEAFIGTKSESQFIEIQSFPHAISKNKKLASIDWQPNNKAVVALSTVDIRDLNSRLQDSGKTIISNVYIWSFQDPTYPSLILTSPYDVNCIQFNPANPNILAGGLTNGQVILWNMENAEKQNDRIEINMQGEEKPKPQIPTMDWTQLSLLEMSHSNCVTGIQWIPKGKVLNSDAVLYPTETDNECYQFMTLGIDGKLFIWDMRKEKRRLSLKKNEKFKDAWIPYAILSILQLDMTSDLPTYALSVSYKNPYSICCTTTEGELLYADWSPVEKTSTSSAEDDSLQTSNTTFNTSNITKEVYTKQGHHGLGHTISRNPFFDDIIMTVGNTTFKVWKIGCDSPIWTSPFRSTTSYSCGCWSPTRPGVVFLGRADGYIEVWDFLEKSHNLSMISHFSIAQQNIPLTELKFRIGHGNSKFQYQFIAVGTGNASLSIVEVPKNLIRPLPDEEKLVFNFFNREYERVLYFQEKWKIREQESDEKKLEVQPEEVTAENGGTIIEEPVSDPTTIPVVEKKLNIDKVAIKKRFLEMIQ
ncbi:hypothetical protein ABK040_008608 [Willaertia magna]